MKKETIKVGGKEKVLNLKKSSKVGKVIGLMFKSKNTNSLLFEFNKKTSMKIHSFFVFFDFLVLWIDDKNNVIDFKIVKPFTLSVKSKKPFSKVIEIPVNKKNREDIEFFVGKGKI